MARYLFHILRTVIFGITAMFFILISAYGWDGIGYWIDDNVHTPSDFLELTWRSAQSLMPRPELQEILTLCGASSTSQGTTALSYWCIDELEKPEVFQLIKSNNPETRLRTARIILNKYPEHAHILVPLLSDQEILGVLSGCSLTTTFLADHLALELYINGDTYFFPTRKSKPTHRHKEKAYLNLLHEVILSGASSDIRSATLRKLAEYDLPLAQSIASSPSMRFHPAPYVRQIARDVLDQHSP